MTRVSSLASTDLPCHVIVLVLRADISLTSSAGALTEMFKVLGVPSLVKDENDPRKVQKEWNEGQMRPVVIKVTEVSAA